MFELDETTLTSFDKNASRYHKEVYTTKRKELAEKLDSALHAMFVQQLRNIHKKSIQSFLEALKTSLAADDPNFMKNLKRIREKLISSYREQAEGE